MPVFVNGELRVAKADEATRFLRAMKHWTDDGLRPVGNVNMDTVRVALAYEWLDRDGITEHGRDVLEEAENLR